MAKETKIEWADSTFNGWIGCTKVSPACDHCYAAVSTPARTNGTEWGPGKPRLRTARDNWKLPERWNREPFYRCTAGCGWRGATKGIGCLQCGGALFYTRRRVFCHSLGDWLDKEVPIEWLADLLQLIHDTPNLDWLLLTKRVGNWRSSLAEAASTQTATALRYWIVDWLEGKAPANVWIGATVVNQAEADRDVPKLLHVPARVRFLSIEPMLAHIDLRSWVDCNIEELGGQGSELVIPAGLHWVICGGESGPRPMHPDWVRSLRDQCAAAGVAFLFKQWGDWLPVDAADHPVYKAPWKFEHGQHFYKVGKHVAGNTLDGRQHLEFPEAPHAG